MLSIESQLKDWLRLRSMSIDSFALVCSLEGIPNTGKTRLHAAVAGRALPGDVATKVWKLRTEIEALCKAAEPLRLDLSNGASVHELIREMREQNLTVVVFRESESAEQSVA